jgi:hypothetical protein
VDEEVLHGGVANAGAVVRVGPHVLRPSGPHTPSIHRFLTRLADAGFDGAPVPVGVDPDGRERLRYIEGEVALPPYPPWVQSDDALASVAVLLRRFHEAGRRLEVTEGRWSDEMADPLGGPVVCHNDVCLENVVFRDGVAVALLDFDFAAPGRPAHDLAAFARMCVPVDDPVSASRLGWAASDGPRRVAVIAEAYGLDVGERRQLLALLGDSIEAGGRFLQRRIAAGDENFIRMWAEIGGMERFDRRRTWWREHRHRFEMELLR